MRGGKKPSVFKRWSTCVIQRRGLTLFDSKPLRTDSSSGVKRFPNHVWLEFVNLGPATCEGNAPLKDSGPQRGPWQG